jgi:hypothetical protein
LLYLLVLQSFKFWCPFLLCSNYGFISHCKSCGQSQTFVFDELGQITCGCTDRTVGTRDHSDISTQCKNYHNPAVWLLYCFNCFITGGLGFLFILCFFKINYFLVKFDPKNVSFVVFKLKKKRYKPKFSEYSCHVLCFLFELQICR